MVTYFNKKDMLDFANKCSEKQVTNSDFHDWLETKTGKATIVKDHKGNMKVFDSRRIEVSEQEG